SFLKKFFACFVGFTAEPAPALKTLLIGFPSVLNMSSTTDLHDRIGPDLPDEILSYSCRRRTSLLQSSLPVDAPRTGRRRGSVPASRARVLPCVSRSHPPRGTSCPLRSRRRPL